MSPGKGELVDGLTLGAPFSEGFISFGEQSEKISNKPHRKINDATITDSKKNKIVLKKG